MKRCVTVLAVFALMISLFSGCASKEKYAETIHERIHKNFYDIQNYTAKCTITVHAKDDHLYNAKIDYDKKENRFDLIYNDIEIVVSDSEASVKKGNSIIKTVPSESYMPIFVNNFFEKYYSGEQSSLNVSSSKTFGATTLEAVLSQTDKNAAKEKLWIDNKSALPIKAELYNSNGDIYMEIVFKDFTFK